MVSHTTSGEWQSFELRMRRRRAERLVLRAEAAAEAGCLDDARRCLSEAKALEPGLPALGALEQRLSPSPPRQVQTASTSKRRFPAAQLVAAAAIALMFLVGWTIVSRSPVPAADTASAEAPATARNVPSEPVSTQPLRPEPLPPPAAVFTSETAAVTPIETPAPKPVAAQPEPRDLPVTVREPEETVPRAPLVGPLPPADSTPGRVTVPPAPSMTVASAPAAAAIAALPIASNPSPPPAAAAPVPAPTPPPAPSQEPAVRSALDRYAAAYSALDVDAAQRVWPSVNRGALSRAFESLASQQVSLGDCEINVAAGSATARCAGSASWAPKVGGGGPRTESREWTFELARSGAGWQIVSARVQNR